METKLSFYKKSIKSRIVGDFETAKAENIKKLKILFWKNLC